MLREYVGFKFGGYAEFKVNDISLDNTTFADETHIKIRFNSPVDRVIAEDFKNYLFTDIKNDNHDVRDLNGRIVTEQDGYEVVIILPDFDVTDFRYFRILDTLKSLSGLRLDSTYYANFSSIINKARVNVVGGTVRYVGGNDYVVTPNTNSKNVTITTNAYGNITVNGNLDNLTVNAPNTHLIVTGNVDVLDIIAVGSQSVEIRGSVKKVIVKTAEPFKIYGNVKDLKIVSTVADAKVSVGTTSANVKPVVLVKDEEVVIDPETPETPETEEEKVAAAEKAVLAFETSKTAADKVLAEAAVAKVAAGEVKDAFEARIAEVVVEDGEEPGDKTALELATAAVEKAELSQTQEDKDAAALLVFKLEAGDVKDELAARVEAIQVEVTTETGVKSAGAVTTKGAAVVPAVPAEAEVKATLVINTDITIESKLEGEKGNDITVEVKKGDARQELEVKVVGNDITIVLPADALGNNVEVTNEVLVTAINAKAGAIVKATVADGKEDEVINDVVKKALLENGKDAVVAKDEVEAIKEVYTLTITNGATKSGEIKIDGVTTHTGTNVIAGMTAADVVQAIKSGDLEMNGYVVTYEGNKIVFTAVTAGVETALELKVVDK